MPLFLLTELRRDGSGAYRDTPVQFRWSERTRTIPREYWKWKIVQRTTREEYGHGVEPTEQILGASFEPFTLSGLWDDKWAGVGFANATWKAFEDLARRGNMVRVEFDDIVFHGIVKDFEPTYYRKEYVGYAFTVSPHYRRKPGDEFGTVVQRATQLDWGNVIRVRVARLIAAHNLARKEQIKGDTFSKISTALDSVSREVIHVNDLLGKYSRGSIGKGISVVAQVATAYRAIQGLAEGVVTLARGLTSDGIKAYDSAVGLLDLESWVRNVRVESLLIAADANKAAKATIRLNSPDTLALYHPQAGESLYSISDRFYQTPRKWRLIYDRNGLTSFTLTGSELLVIPRATSYTGSAV